MSQYDPSATPAPPPGAPPPGADPDRLLARRGVQWTIISLVVSTLLTLLGFYLQGRHSDDGGDFGKSSTTGGTSLTGDTSGGGTDGGSAGGAVSDPSDEGTGPSSPGPTPTPTPSDTDTDTDILTPAERSLRDSLNTAQWQRDSCEHWTMSGATIALRCTVTTQDANSGTGTGKVVIGKYASQDQLQSTYLSYAGNLPLGNCATQVDVRNYWYRSNTDVAAGVAACYWTSSTVYTMLWTLNGQPVLLEVQGTNPAAVAAWWRTIGPVFES
jgi:hypothetical protein